MFLRETSWNPTKKIGRRSQGFHRSSSFFSWRPQEDLGSQKKVVYPDISRWGNLPGIHPGTSCSLQNTQILRRTAMESSWQIGEKMSPSFAHLIFCRGEWDMRAYRFRFSSKSVSDILSCFNGALADGQWFLSDPWVFTAISIWSPWCNCIFIADQPRKPTRFFVCNLNTSMFHPNIIGPAPNRSACSSTVQCLQPNSNIINTEPHLTLDPALCKQFHGCQQHPVNNTTWSIKVGWYNNQGHFNESKHDHVTCNHVTVMQRFKKEALQNLQRWHLVMLYSLGPWKFVPYFFIKGFSDASIFAATTPGLMVLIVSETNPLISWHPAVVGVTKTENQMLAFGVHRHFSLVRIVRNVGNDPKND